MDEKIKANIGKIPAGIPMPQITVRGISDVPIVVLTLTPEAGGAGSGADRWNERNLYDLASKLRSEVAKVDDAVSYTHLDVYKRQSRWGGRAPRRWR